MPNGGCLAACATQGMPGENFASRGALVSGGGGGKGKPPGTGIFADRDLVRGPAGLPIGDLFGDRHVALR